MNVPSGFYGSRCLLESPGLDGHSTAFKMHQGVSMVVNWALRSDPSGCECGSPTCHTEQVT